MPVAAAAGLGEPPPPPPRELPRAFERRIRYTNGLFLGGAVVLAVGLLQGISFTAIGATTGSDIFFAIGPVILVIVGSLGAALLYFARRRAAGILAAFHRGQAVVGRITDVYRDTTVTINGRSPWALVYAYRVGAQELTGKAQCWDPGHQGREIGQPVHVLYLPEDPEHSTLWPPIR